MKICSRCNLQMGDNQVYCPNCGMPTGGSGGGQWGDYYNHTAEFNPRDISDNKMMAMLPYLMGTMGIVIALLASRESPYTYFHIRQAVKMKVTQLLLNICTVVLCWTILVPIAATVCNIIIFVLQIIAFFQVCRGQAKEPAIIRDLPFLK